MKRFLIFIIISKPILDLFWNFTIAGVNISGLLAFLLTFIYISMIIKSYKKNNLYINKYSFNLSIYALFISCVLFMILPKSQGIIGSLTNSLRLVSPMVFLVYLGKNCNIEEIEKIMKLYILVSLIPIIISYLQVLGVVEYTYWDYIDGNSIARASGGYRQPSVLTRMLIFTNLFSLYFISTKERGRFKYIIYLILSFVSIFYTFHRTGYLITVVSILLWFILTFRISTKSILKTISILMVLSLMFLFFIYRIDSEFLSILKNLISLDNIFKIENGEFRWILRGRSGLIEQLTEAIKIQPISLTILGNGIDINAYTRLSMTVADMDWIRIFWQYGVIGLILWFGQIISFLKGVLVLIKYEYIDRRYKNILNVGLIIIVGYIIMGCTIEATTSPNFMYMIYLFMSFILYNKNLFFNNIDIGEKKFEHKDKYNNNIF